MATGGDIDIAVQLRFLDALSSQVQRPIAAMNQLKAAIGQTAGEATRTTGVMARLAQAYDNLAARAERAAARMTAARSSAMRAAVGLFTLAGPLRDASQFQLGSLRLLQIEEWDRQFARMGRFEAMHGPARSMRDRITRMLTASAYRRGPDGRLALTPEGLAAMNRLQLSQLHEFVTLSMETNQSAAALLASMQQVAGLTGAALNRPQMLQMVRQAAIAATATGGELRALMASSISVFQNLGVRPEDMGTYWDIMHMGGKLGGFEIPDAAVHFPRITSAIGQLMNLRREVFRQQLIAQGLTGEALRSALTMRNSEFGLDLTANLMSYMQITRRANHDAETTATAIEYLIQKTGLQEFMLHGRKFTNYRLLAQHPDWAAYGLGGMQRYVDRRENELTRGTPRAQRQNPTFNVRMFLADQSRQGVDPVLASLRFMSMMTDIRSDDPNFITDFFNAHSELRALRPMLEEYRRLRAVDRERGLPIETSWRDTWPNVLRNARGIIEQDYAASVEMLSTRFDRLINNVRSFGLLFTSGGALSPVSKLFAFLAMWLETINIWAIRNQEAFQSIARVIWGIVGALGALAIGRFLWAALGVGLLRAGMGALSLLRVLPGLGIIGGLMGGALGWLLKLGVVGGVGFLAYQHWDLLKASAEPVLAAIGRFFERLAVLFRVSVACSADSACGPATSAACLACWAA